MAAHVDGKADLSRVTTLESADRERAETLDTLTGQLRLAENRLQSFREGVTVNLLNPGELYGEGYSIFDVKLGKNFRFAGKRINLGVDIFNVLNNDAIRSYEDDLDQEDNPNTPFVEQWGQATGLLSPRFVRLSVQFDF